MKTKTYIVTVIPKAPTYGDTGVDFKIFAKNKKNAISNARKLVRIGGCYDRFDGPLTYSAEELVDEAI